MLYILKQTPCSFLFFVKIHIILLENVYITILHLIIIKTVQTKTEQ